MSHAINRDRCSDKGKKEEKAGVGWGVSWWGTISGKSRKCPRGAGARTCSSGLPLFLLRLWWIPPIGQEWQTAPKGPQGKPFQLVGHATSVRTLPFQSNYRQPLGEWLWLCPNHALVTKQRSGCTGLWATTCRRLSLTLGSVMPPLLSESVLQLQLLLT